MTTDTPPRSLTRTRLSTAAALSAAAALGLHALSATPAWAHDVLLSTSPEDGEVVEESPEEILLEFSGLAPGEDNHQVEILDDDGDEWAHVLTVEDATLSATLEDELPHGSYQVSYEVVFSDGHTGVGDFAFEVDDPEGADVDDAAADEDEEAEATPIAAQEEDSATEAAESDDADPDDQDAEPAVADQDEQGGGLPAWAWALVGGGLVIAVIAGGLVIRKRSQTS